MNEIWAIIKTNPDYKISNYGRVMNISTKHILIPSLHVNKRCNTTDYYRIELKHPRKKYLVHRLVAEAFIYNPNNYKEINHIDQNGLNNSVDNLEWCSAKYNVRYSQSKPVIKMLNNGDVIERYDSMTDAANMCNADIRLISAVCLGKRRSHGGFMWMFENKNDIKIKRHGRIAC